MKNNLIIFIFLLCFMAIGSALVAEYFFDLFPCKMCLKQRHPYYFIITIITLFYIFGSIRNILLFILNEIAILYGLFYSIWHIGIERGILRGPESCSGTLIKTNSIQNLKDQISNQEIVSCSEITWTILGFSAATINTLLLLLIFIFNTIYIIKYFYDSKKN